MPAIQLARLKQQIEPLAEDFARPEAFVRRLHAFLETYADRTQRPGQSGAPRPLLEAYNVPAPALRELIYALKALAPANPEATLALCDALWAERYLECRLLAAHLLGALSPEQAEAVLKRISLWGGAGVEERLLKTLLDQGLARLRREAGDKVLRLAAEQLSAPEPLGQQLGLQILLSLLDEPDFENLPAVFRLLSPYLRLAPASLRPDIVAVLTRLARLSPQETAFVLKQVLETVEAPDPVWLTRQVLDEFPPETRRRLRERLP